MSSVTVFYVIKGVENKKSLCYTLKGKKTTKSLHTSILFFLIFHIFNSDHSSCYAKRFTVAHKQNTAVKFQTIL